MLRLFGYIAGGAAVLLALDVSVPALGTGLSLFRQSSTNVGAAPAMHVLDRTRKGDKQVTTTLDKRQDQIIATVEVVGLRDAAVVYRARDGRVLFSTDPIANATIVAKGVVLPEVTIRDTRRTTIETVPAAASRTQPAPSRPGATTPEEKKILEGCDPAFSPLTASARSNFSGRCLANLPVPMRVAAAVLP